MLAKCRYHEKQDPMRREFPMKKLMTALIAGMFLLAAAPLYAASSSEADRQISFAEHYLKEFEPNSFFWTTYGFLIVLTVLTACMVALSKRKGRELILVFLLVMEFLLSVRASNVYLDSSSFNAMSWIHITCWTSFIFL